MYHRGIVWMPGSLMAWCELDAYRRRSVLILMFASGCWRTNWSKRQPTIIGESCHKYHFCRDKRVFVATKNVFCHDKNMHVATKTILVAATAKDSQQVLWEPSSVSSSSCWLCGGLANEQHCFHRKPLRFAPPPCCTATLVGSINAA